LKAEKTKTTIPPNSKIRFSFETYCLNHDYGAPDADWPIIPVYKKLDIPLASEIISYSVDHKDLDQGLAQEVIWRLLEKSDFDGIFEDGQALLLEINPQAQEIVDSYHYDQNFSVENFDYAEKLPEEVIAQPIAGAELYAKISDSASYSWTEIEVFNPSSKPQVFSLVQDDKVLVLMPKEWVKSLSKEDSKWHQLLYSFYPVKVEARGSGINPFFKLHPRNKFQMKWPTSTTGVRG